MSQAKPLQAEFQRNSQYSQAIHNAAFQINGRGLRKIAGGTGNFPNAETKENLLGNALFSSRFVIQWLHSERKKQLTVPPIFWHLSFWGSAISLIYALHIDKVPVILSFAFLPPLYARNLVLLKRGVAATRS